MRGRFIRDLIDRMDIRREKEYAIYTASEPETGSLEDADRDLAIGRYHFLNGNYMDSIREYESAIKKYNALQDKVGESYTLIYMSMNYREMQNIDEARKVLRKANYLGVSLGDNYVVLSTIINSLTLYSLEGRTEEVENLRIRAGAMIQDVGYPKLTGDYYNTAGQALINMDRYEDALSHLQMAYDAYSAHYGDEGAVNILIVRINKAFVLTKLKRYDEALREIEDLERIIRERNFDVALIFEVYTHRMEIYEAIGDFERAYDYAKKGVQDRNRWLEEMTRRPRKETAELRQELENSQLKFLENNEKLKHNNELLEEIIKNNELVRNIGSKLTATYELDKIFEIISCEIKRFLPFNSLTVSIVEGDHLVVRHATLVNAVDIPLPYHIPLSGEEFITSYCIRNNVDVKIDRQADFLRYVPKKYERLSEEARKKESPGPDNESAIYCRLIRNGKPIGILSIQNDVSDSYGELEFDAIKSIASFISIAIINSMKNRQIQEKAVELEQLALLDPLTKLSNRRAYRLKVEELQKSGADFALIFGDLNHLKVINDNLGHEQGDRYLVAISDVLRSECGENPVYRLSGDEFASLIVGISREKLCEIIEKIKSRCEQTKVGEYPLSISIGCSYRSCCPSANNMFMRAESRMYLDKHDYYLEYGNCLDCRERHPSRDPIPHPMRGMTDADTDTETGRS